MIPAMRAAVTRDGAPGRAAPLAVVALIAVHVAVFAYEVWLGLADDSGQALTAFVETWGLVPRELASDVRALRPTPLTAMFVHAGLVHLAGNLGFLWLFGRDVERLLGPARLLALYFAAGLAAAAVQVAWDPGAFAPLVGSSGGVAGVLGVALVAPPRRRARMPGWAARAPAVTLLVAWVLLQVLGGLESRGRAAAGVAWWAHVGGFAVGAGLGRVWLRRPAGSRLRS